MKKELIKIPTNSKSTKQDFERIGLDIIDIIKDEYGKEIYITYLPSGWRISSRAAYHSIYDSENNERVNFYYGPKISNRTPISKINTRYTIMIYDASQGRTGDGESSVSFFDNKERKTIYEIVGEKIESSYKIIEKWANENYPNWKDSNFYWNSEKNKKI